jgi:bacteriocin-like protein
MNIANLNAEEDLFCELSVDELHQVIGGQNPVVITCTRDTSRIGETTTTCTSSDGTWRSSLTVYKN